ncbi:hypothetical protein D3C71_1587900 [compost metagenome]
MLVEQIDAVGLQPRQAGLGHRADTLGATVQARIGMAILEAELGGDHELVAERGQRLAEQFLVEERPIGFGGIEEGHALLDRGAQQRDRLAAVGRRTIAIAQPHAAQPEGGNPQAAAAQFTCLHGGAPAGGTGVMGDSHDSPAGYGDWIVRSAVGDERGSSIEEDRRQCISLAARR